MLVSGTGHLNSLNPSLRASSSGATAPRGQDRRGGCTVQFSAVLLITDTEWNEEKEKICPGVLEHLSVQIRATSMQLGVERGIATLP